MGLHPRYLIEREAELELRQAVSDVLNKHDLTVLEAIRLLNMVCSDRITSIVKYELRVERHGNADDPADLE